MSRLSVIALRLLQTLLAVGTLGVSAYVVNWYRTKTSQTPPGSIDYLLSASIISMVSILYLEISPRFFRRAAHPYATLTVEGLNTVLYFAGFIAIAVHVGSLTLCNSTACRATRGDSVLAAAAFCAWIASATLTAKQMIVGGPRRRARPGIRRCERFNMNQREIVQQRWYHEIFMAARNVAEDDKERHTKLPGERTLET